MARAWRHPRQRRRRGCRRPDIFRASLVKGQTRFFLVYRNYRAILDYNCSNSYAIAVGLLADQIAR